MPPQIIQDNIWKDRISDAERYYKEWAHLFKCNTLEAYMEGFQYAGQRQLDYNPYVINKIYETLEIKVAQFVPTFPKFTVTAKPSASEYDPETAYMSGQIKEDTLNTIINNDKQHFADEVESAYRDSFFRFGVLEVGYAADWILNPNAPKPLLKGQTDKNITSKQRFQIKQEPAELPANERIYIKHVRAKRFRVGGIDHRYLDRCTWVGYYDFIDKDDLLSLKGVMNRDKINTARTSDGESNVEMDKSDSNIRIKGALKIWRLWDLRAGLQLLVLDSPCITVFQRKFKRLPLFDIRHNKRSQTDGFYPVPPVFQWISPQDEINEIREQLRNHRRRFIRKFQVLEGSMDDPEIEKFETGPDGCIIKVKRENAITPIQNADLGAALSQSVVLSSDDLNKISATSSEARGQADRTTATQAQIVDRRSGLRENKDRDRVTAWLCKVAREILLTAKDKIALGIWVEMNSAEGENFLGEVQEQNTIYKWITSEDLSDNYDFRTIVDLTSMSEDEMQAEADKMIKYLQILAQFPMVAFSPILVREIAYRVGYRNDKVIKEFQKMALLQELGRMNQLQAALGPASPNGQPGNQPQALQAQMQQPGMEQLKNQLTQQLGGGQVQ